MQFAKDHDRLARQRHAVRPLHLHGLGRHRPYCLIKIDLPPARQAQFARPNEQQRGELERETGGRLPAVALDGPQEGTELLTLNPETSVADAKRIQKVPVFHLEIRETELKMYKQFILDEIKEREDYQLVRTTRR
jgi:hypothetical protein